MIKKPSKQVWHRGATTILVEILAIEVHAALNSGTGCVGPRHVHRIAAKAPPKQARDDCRQ
jgi:hypothetical protein